MIEIKHQTTKGILYNDDMFKILPELEDSSFDLICCDLPYNTTQCKWDKEIIDLPLFFSHVNRLIKPNGTILLFGQGKFTAKLIQTNEKIYRYSLIYEKTTPTGHLNAKRQPMRSHEDMVVFYKKQNNYYPQKTTGHVRKVSSASHKRNSKQTEVYNQHGLTGYDSTERYPTSVWKIKTDKQQSTLHPTQKPLDLLRKIVKSYSKEGDLVGDFCFGSNTTGIVCHELDRNYIGIEFDDDNYNKGLNRYNQ